MSGIKSYLTKVSSLLLVALGFFSCQDTITLEGEGIISGEAFDTNQATFNVFVTNKSVAAVQTNKLPCINWDILIILFTAKLLLL